MKSSELLTALAGSARVRLVDWANWALGCSHRNTSFPLSVRTGVPDGRQPSPPPRVYVVCLSCGKRLSYNDHQRASGLWRGALKDALRSRQPHRGLK